MPYTPATASSVGTVQWVRTPDALSQLTRHLRGAAAIALDTESDSLHHFPEKVCLLQVATPDGAAYLVDRLAVPDLAPLGEVCADPGTVKILHGAAYDVASLKRDFGFRFARLFDTMVAAQFLGLAEAVDRFVRVTRSSMLETLRQDYVRTARAKGVTPRVVIAKHARLNALLPVVTISGAILDGLLNGAAITETVFNWPGIGQATVQAATNLDVVTILGLTLFTATLLILGNLVVDIMYAYLDPRVRLG